MLLPAEDDAVWEMIMNNSGSEDDDDDDEDNDEVRIITRRAITRKHPR